MFSFSLELFSLLSGTFCVSGIFLLVFVGLVVSTSRNN